MTEAQKVLYDIANENPRNDWSIYNHMDYFDGTASTVLKAMELFAKQEAIAFKEWQDSALEERKWENYDGHDTWINPHTKEVISTEQLYERYLKSR